MQRLVAKSILEFRLTKIFYYINTTSVSQKPRFQPERILHYYIIRSATVYLDNFVSPKTICCPDVFQPSSLSNGFFEDNTAGQETVTVVFDPGEREK